MVSSLVEQTKMFSQVMCISLLGQEREAVGKTVQTHMVMLFPVVFTVHSASALSSLAMAKAK